MKRVGDFTKKAKNKVRPRYTIVLHEVREKLDLSLSSYVVIDSINKLSRTNPDYPYCTMSKEQLAMFLKLSRATVFRAIEQGVKQELVERTKEGHLRSTQKWVEMVEIYSIKYR